MAITATFEANFAQFVQEVEKATGSLGKIEGTSHEVGAAIEDLKSTAESLAGAFGIAFSVGAAVEFLRTITDEAKALSILSLQTQISTDDLQILAAATKEYGVDSEQLGRAIFQLSQRIAGGDSSVVTGLALMGLSLDDVKNKHGEELFMLVEHAAGQLHGTIRDTAMADLYGARLGSSLGALSTGIDEAVDKAQALITKMGPESLAAATEYANSIERATTNLHAMSVEMLGPLLQGFNVVAEASQKGAGFWAIAAAIAKDTAESWAGFGPVTTNLTTLLDHLNQKTEENAKVTAGASEEHKKIVVAMTDEEKHAEFLATLQKNAAVALSEQNLKDLAQLKEMGQLNAKNAEGIGVNAAQLAKYTAGIEAEKKAVEELAKAQAEADAIAMTGYQNRIKLLEQVTAANQKAYGFEGQIENLHQLEAAETEMARAVYNSLTSEKDRAKVIEELSVRMAALKAQEMALQVKHAAVVNAAIISEFDAQVKLNASYGEAADGTLKVSSASETLRIKLIDLENQKVKGIDTTKEQNLLMAQYAKALYDEAVASDAAAAAAARLAEELKKVTAAKKDSRDSFSLVGSPVPDKFKNWTEEMKRNAGYIDLYGRITPAGEAAGLGYSARASGGPVSAGQSYLVGERGPELYTPGASGFITPNGGGSQTFNIYVTQPLGTPAAIAHAVDEALAARYRNTGQRF